MTHSIKWANTSTPHLSLSLSHPHAWTDTLSPCLSVPIQYAHAFILFWQVICCRRYNSLSFSLKLKLWSFLWSTISQLSSVADFCLWRLCCCSSYQDFELWSAFSGHILCKVSYIPVFFFFLLKQASIESLKDVPFYLFLPGFCVRQWRTLLLKWESLMRQPLRIQRKQTLCPSKWVF